MDRIIKGLEQKINQLNEQLEEEKDNATKSISDINDARIGITKYSENIMITLAKIDSYKEILNIVKYYNK
ncbi:hypothetical protein [Clostridium sp. VAP52]|uniref:hypothetical protein n=1 Tax=Clostridium sp. VAP52 TaxID=2949977 RepID=UPI00207B096A|nr:hypothetical protein [Clostridium sp. VAP52]